MCDNPFWKCHRKKYRPKVYIYYKNRILSICDECWDKIGKSDIEWSSGMR